MMLGFGMTDKRFGTLSCMPYWLRLYAKETKLTKKIPGYTRQAPGGCGSLSKSLQAL